MKEEIEPQIVVESQKVCKNCLKPMEEKGKAKFCSKGCKGLYNRKTNDEYIDNTIKTLLSNRDILKNDFKNKKKVITKESLIKDGFDFNCYTKYSSGLFATTKIYCFEYGVE